MRLLLVNDDGVYSPGLLALAQAARRFGEVRIVAGGGRELGGFGDVR